MGRTLAAYALPALVVSWAWLQLEDPRRLPGAGIVVALALVPALVPRGWRQVVAASAAVSGTMWLVLGAQPWELLPYRDERVLQPALDDVGQGIADFYTVLLPFDPTRNPEMHSLVLLAILGFTLGVSLFVARRRPVGAAAVTVAGAGWPATLVSDQTLAIGAAALAAALSIPLVLRVRSTPALLAGTATTLLLVLGATWVSSATTLATKSALDWQAWDLRGSASQVRSVRFAWESNYKGARFPTKKTVVFTVEGPKRATYWRASTLDLFTDDHWFENLLWLSRVEGGLTRLSPGRLIPDRVLKRESWVELTPSGAQRRESWLEQEVEIHAFVDDHLIAAGTPVAIDAGRLGPVFQLSSSVLRVRDPIRGGTTYRVWSYVPDPSPAELVASRPRYPFAASRFLKVHGREFPPFGALRRQRLVEALFEDPSYATFLRYRPMYAIADRVARGARTPYATVLALESWFRQRGGFRYDESPPRIRGAPLVDFVTRTRAGYCQHFAGAMAAMLRMLGVPARVAVGFTSGTRGDDGRWIVTDHNAHAWVEAWFAGIGWVPFDPTPGRGTFGGRYSFASDSEEAVAALRRGDLSSSGPRGDRPVPDSADIVRSGDVVGDAAPSLFALALLLGALWALAVGLGKSGVRRVRYLTRDPRRLATASRWELEGFLRDQGVIIPRGATLLTLERAVSDEFGLDGRAFAVAAARARFGPPGEAAGGATRARRELRALLKRARRELSLWARIRGFVSLRSLHGGASP